MNKSLQMQALALVNAFIFILLSSLHFYWASGGRRGLDVSLLVKESGELLFRPSKGTTIAVAFWLLLFAVVMLGQFIDTGYAIIQKASRAGAWVVAVIFLARAVGDFRYVGFFKKVRSTAFAVNDTRIYSPLCIVLSSISFLVASGHR